MRRNSKATKKKFGRRKMRPYGEIRKGYYFSGKIDYHIHKGNHKVHNWWEIECQPEPNNRAVRRNAKQNLRNIRLSLTDFSDIIELAQID